MNLNVYIIIMTYDLMNLGNGASLVMARASPSFHEIEKLTLQQGFSTDWWAVGPLYGGLEAIITTIFDDDEKAPSPKNREVFSEGSEAKIDCESRHEARHQWFHSYQNGTDVIDNIPVLKEVKKTHYSFIVEKFDNNTEIFCVKLSLSIDPLDEPLKTQIEVLFTPGEVETPPILPYSEAKEVLFNCQEDVNEMNEIKYTYVSVINTTSNIMKIYTGKSIYRTFNITQNKSILCCVHYVVNETAKEKWITRLITNKTLLVYTSRQDVIQNKGITSSNSTGTSSSRRPAAAGTNAEYTGSSNQTTTYITLIVIAVVVIILLAIIVVCKKRCRKPPKSDTKVLYASLDLLRQTDTDTQKPDPNEESPYAQIIGELRRETHDV